MSFTGQIKKFNRKAEKAATMIFRGTSLSLFEKIVRRTPVDTGRARGNWMAGINRPSSDSPGYESVVARARLGDSLFLTNNLPYIGVLENGSSEQAPHGMVAVTVTEFRQVVSMEARK